MAGAWALEALLRITCVSLFEPADSKVGTLKHIPRALTPRGQGPCGPESRPLGGGTFLHPCVPPSICPAHSPETGLSRQPGRWRQHTRRWISEEGQAWGGAPPGDELLGKEPGPPEGLPSVYATLAATSPSQKPALIFPRVRPRITLVLKVETVPCSHRDLGTGTPRLTEGPFNTGVALPAGESKQRAGPLITGLTQKDAPRTGALGEGSWVLCPHPSFLSV